MRQNGRIFQISLVLRGKYALIVAKPREDCHHAPAFPAVHHDLDRDERLQAILARAFPTLPGRQQPVQSSALVSRLRSPATQDMPRQRRAPSRFTNSLAFLLGMYAFLDHLFQPDNHRRISGLMCGYDDMRSRAHLRMAYQATEIAGVRKETSSYD
jgi:hypothetical protein